MNSPDQYQTPLTNDSLTIPSPSCTDNLSKGLGGIIRKFMNLRKLKEADLARQINLPQTTVNRLLTHESPDPRLSTILPIANFLGLTLGQLVGIEPISEGYLALNNPNCFSTHSLSLTTIPLLAWNNVLTWFSSPNPSHEIYRGWLCTERKLGIKAFALDTMSFMEPRFKLGSKIIIDPSTCLMDGAYVLAMLQGNVPTVRRILNEGTDIYLKPFDPGMPSLKLEPSYQILGSIIEVRETPI